MTDPQQPVGLLCPNCNQAPSLVVGPTQVFCGNNDCNVLAWNPQLTLDELAADTKLVDLPEMPMPTTEVHDPGGTGHEITTLYCWVAVHGEGDEGIISHRIGDREMPLIGSSQVIVGIRNIVAEVVAQTGKSVRLLRFDLVGEIDRIDP